MKVKKIIYIIALVILLTVFAVSAVYVIGYFVEGAKQKAEYDELAGIVESIQQETLEYRSATFLRSARARLYGLFHFLCSLQSVSFSTQESMM